MYKRILSMIFIIIILGFIIFLLVRNSKDEILPVGSNLPGIEYSGISGCGKLHSEMRPVIIIYFSPTCGHCQYQLKVFNRHIKQFKNMTIYFLTTAKNFFDKKLNTNWNNLNSSTNVIFGIINKDTFKKNFGYTITPSFFFFSDKGKLKEKIKGELKLTMILKITRSLTSGRAESAV